MATPSFALHCADNSYVITMQSIAQMPRFCSLCQFLWPYLWRIDFRGVQVHFKTNKAPHPINRICAAVCIAEVNRLHIAPAPKSIGNRSTGKVEIKSFTGELHAAMLPRLGKSRENLITSYHARREMIVDMTMEEPNPFVSWDHIC